MNPSGDLSTLEAQPSDAVDGARLNELLLLVERLQAIHLELSEIEQVHDQSLAKVHADQRASALNLIRYLRLRQRDLRPLQSALSSLGLSSLGRSEAHVLKNVRAVLRALQSLAGQREGVPAVETAATPELPHPLDHHTDALLGPRPKGRSVRIMVTMPSTAASDEPLLDELLSHGMDCARINCAHDDAETWGQMIANIRQAEARTGRHCRVLMDLAGPKLRTGSLEAGPEVVKWRPTRDPLGQVVRPARIWLTPPEQYEPEYDSADAVLPVEGRYLALLRPGHRLQLRDARGKRRVLTIVQEVGNSRRAESTETAYVTSGTSLEVAEDAGPADWPSKHPPCVGRLPAVEQFIRLCPGDRLVVTAEPAPGHPAVRDSAGHVTQPAAISCTLPEVIPQVKTGEQIWFDDGQIGGIVREADKERLLVEITRAQATGSKLRADKGINLPDSHLHLPALTAKDRTDLEFVAQNADLVGYSFVHTVHDVTELQRLLGERRAHPPGIVLKIETRAAFQQLPTLLLAAMRSPVAGVMIARGDLGVECGFERLAEVQEEILWICEAAHMPVIWATQVLETLAKSGLPSRAEVTDAAMGVRAECVMLNKGPYIVETLQTLGDILQRMEAHQHKKKSTLRPLGVARSFQA